MKLNYLCLLCCIFLYCGCNTDKQTIRQQHTVYIIKRLRRLHKENNAIIVGDFQSKEEKNKTLPLAYVRVNNQMVTTNEQTNTFTCTSERKIITFQGFMMGYYKDDPIKIHISKGDSLFIQTFLVPDNRILR